MRADTRWQQFVKKLKDVDYFQGELEGSKLYNERLESAERFYMQSCYSVDQQRTSADDPGMKLLSLLKSTTFDMEAMRQMEKQLPLEDDDSWMTLSPQKLDDMMNSLAGNRRTKFIDEQTGGQTGRQTDREFDPSRLASSMNAFVNNISSHEGAEFPKGDQDEEIQFDPNSFMQSMQKMFDFEDDRVSDSSSEMDEYESEEELDDTPGSTARLRHKPASRRPAPTAHHTAGKTQGKDDAGKYHDMQEYIEAMDLELSRTTIGKSFVREGDEDLILGQQPKAPPRKKKTVQSQKLNGSTKATPNATSSSRHRADFDDDIDDEDDDFRPVNVDLNAVKNLLDSYQAQAWGPGPASNILSSMGVNVPPPAGKVSGAKKKTTPRRPVRDEMDDY